MRESTLLASFAIFIAATDNAYAYLDPGTGSIILQAIAGVASTLFAVRMYWSRIKETLSAQTSAEKPRFVFAHFLVPHPPFVMDAAGRCMGLAEARARSRTENYTGQVTYTNKAILDFIDQRLAAPGPKPIIILQADEGPWPKRFADDEVSRLGRDVTNVPWTKASEAELREKMAIFSAIYLPDADEEVFPSDRTPVNTFRTVLNREFGTALPLLPNRYFVFQDNGNLYRFHEVTQKLTGPGPTAELK